MNSLIFYSTLEKDYKKVFNKELDYNILTTDNIYKLYDSRNFELDDKNRIIEIW